EICRVCPLTALMAKLPSRSVEVPLPVFRFITDAPLMAFPLESVTFPCTGVPTSCAYNNDDRSKLTAVISIPETILFRNLNFRIWSLVFLKSDVGERGLSDGRSGSGEDPLSGASNGCIRSIVVLVCDSQG